MKSGRRLLSSSSGLAKKKASSVGLFAQKLLVSNRTNRQEVRVMSRLLAELELVQWSK